MGPNPASRGVGTASRGGLPEQGVLLTGVLLLLFAPWLAAADWVRIGSVPQRTRAVIVTPTGALLGFAADSRLKKQFVFRTVLSADGSEPRVLDLQASPDFYAYAYDLDGERLCLPFERASGHTKVECYDESLKVREQLELDGVVLSGALVGTSQLWLVEPSAGAVGDQTSLLLMNRDRAGRWAAQRRYRSPSCEARDTKLECGTLEIHPTASQEELVIVPVMGRFDGSAFRYSPVVRWNYRAGTRARTELPAQAVQPEIRKELAPVMGQPIRLIYRSAVSKEGDIAVIPVMPAHESEGLKHNEVWLMRKNTGSWRQLPLTGQATTLAFAGADLFAVSEDGSVWRWRDP